MEPISKWNTTMSKFIDTQTRFSTQKINIYDERNGNNVMNKMIDIISKFKSSKQKVLSLQQLQMRDISEFSLMPQILEFYANKMSDLVQLQVFIDPASDDLQKINGEYVFETVTKIIQQKEIFNRIQKIFTVYKHVTAYHESLIESFFSPLLKKIQKILKVFNFSKINYTELFFNQHCIQQTNQEKIEQEQNKNIGLFLNYNKVKYSDIAVEVDLRIYKMIVEKNNEYYKNEPQFFSEIEYVPDYLESIRKKFDQQIKEIKSKQQ